jgi:hypothetical protein
MDQLLAERDSVNRELRRIIDEPTEGPWGIRVERVEIKDVSLPENMKRSMSRQAEAERERRARIITADGEYQASKRLAAAANVMARDPAALQLRLLQTVVEVAAEKNSTLVMPVPVELLRFFDKLTPAAPAGDRKSAGDSASLADFGDEDVAAAEAEITSGAPLEIPEVPPIPQLPVQAGNGKLAPPQCCSRTQRTGTTTTRTRAYRLRPPDLGTPVRAAAQGVLGGRPVVSAGLSDDMDWILAPSGPGRGRRQQAGVGPRSAVEHRPADIVRNSWSSSTSSRIASGSWSRCQWHSSRPAVSPSPSGAAARAALIA